MTPALALGLEATLLVHLNLNHASLAVAERAARIEEAYWPLLELLDGRPWLRLAFEASGHTLERIQRLAPAWVAELRERLSAGRAAWVGSGDTRLVGPLVPAAVNRWNQALGREAYHRILGVLPRCAFVSHMAWSRGLVDAYLDAGYEALVTGWSTGRAGVPPQGSETWRARHGWTASPTGRRVRLLLAAAGLAGDLQRGVSGASGGGDALESLVRFQPAARARGSEWTCAALSLDGLESLPRAPSRCGALPAIHRLGELCDALHARGFEFTTPERLLERAAPPEARTPAEAAGPVTVPAELRTPLARWALGGWDALALNARCFARARELERRGSSAHDWQLLCRAWGSDLRADLREERWRRLCGSLPGAPVPEPPAPPFVDPPLRVRIDERAGHRLAVATDGVRVVLNLRRGLALDGLAFQRTGEGPLVGTVSRAEFPAASAVAQRTSGHVELALPGAPPVTDLEPVEPEVEELAHCVVVRASVSTARGPLVKEVRVHAQRLELRYGFADLPRPGGSLRAGFVTLLPGAFRDELWLSCANGGATERFALGTLEEAETFLGATDGWLTLDDGRRGFEVAWKPEEAACLPILLRGQAARRGPVRLAFSLAEPDETLRPGARLPDLCLSIRPCRHRG